MRQKLSTKKVTPEWVVIGKDNSAFISETLIESFIVLKFLNSKIAN